LGLSLFLGPTAGIGLPPLRAGGRPEVQFGTGARQRSDLKGRPGVGQRHDRPERQGNDSPVRDLLIPPGAKRAPPSVGGIEK